MFDVLCTCVFAIILLRKRELVTLFNCIIPVVRVYVFVSVPRGAVGWSLICDCGTVKLV